MVAFNWLRRHRTTREGGQDPRDPPRGFLGRLGRDKRAATLPMMAAATIPMIGMVGGAVDMSRAYLVKTRLQQACDAGALAARRVMANATLEQSDKDEAAKFFNINLPDGAYGTEGRTFAMADVLEAGAPTGRVRGTASVTVPTTLMRVFGKEEIALAATCDAELNISNNDIMFVLDVTGSMNCAAADTTSTCSNNGGTEKTNARIKALRTAVVEFYDTMAAAARGDAILRFGFVPYSSGVNVGKLLPSDYLVSNWTYQSRVPNMYRATGTSTSNTSSTSMTKSNCNNYGNKNPVEIDTGDNTFTRITYESSWVGKTDTCNMTETRTDYTKDDTGSYFRNWSYKPVSYDVSAFKTNGSITTRTGSNGSSVTSTWQGCIEERDTVAQATFSAIPANAYDLDIDLIPNSDTTRWRPNWEDVVFNRNTSSNSLADEITDTNRSHISATCPKAARKLAVMTHDDVYNYVNASDFKANGSTYHDFGMIWGGRLLSPTGIFAGENATAANGKPINRHILFMTDGALQPSTTVYGLYGYERLDRRITGGVPSNGDLTNRHLSRFSAMCDAIRAKNITIWVVAYAQTMTTELQNCADPGKAFYASDDAQLRAQFQLIAQQIAELRLAQ